MGFVENNVKLGNFSFPVLRFCSVNIIPRVLRKNILLILHQRYINLATRVSFNKTRYLSLLDTLIP